MEGRPITIRELVDARKQRLGSEDLARLAEGARRIVSLRGKRVVDLDLTSTAVDRVELEKSVLGPSGNMRAPALRLGKTWIVGFTAAAFEELLS